MSLSTIILESGGVFAHNANQDGSGNIGVNVENSVAVTGVFFQASLDTTTGDSGVQTTSFAGATQTNPGYRSAIVTPVISAISGTGPSMTIQPQWSPDGGTTWYALGAAFVGISGLGVSKQAMMFSPGLDNSFNFTSTDLYQAINRSFSLPRTWRLNYTITGTTPSFTITGVYVNYLP